MVFKWWKKFAKTLKSNGNAPTVASTHNHMYMETDGGTVASAVTEF
jgi:hypothetical protein